MSVRFSIDSFKSNFRDGQKSNLFYFLPNFPQDCITGDMNNDRAVYLVRSTATPTSSLEESILPWQGMDFPIAMKHTFQEFTVTFNMDVNTRIRQNFEKWINKIHNPVTNRYAYINEYMLDQRLQLLANDGKVSLEFVLHDAWPREVAQASLSYDASDITQFDVSFRYSYHTLLDSATGG